MAILVDPYNIKWRKKHGSVVGQINRPIAGARRLTRPKNRRHSKQMIFRNQMNLVVIAWHDLLEMERMDWNTFGSLNPVTDKYGNPAYLSGWQWFVKLNKALLAYDSSMIMVPPGTPMPTYDPIFSISQITGSNDLQVEAFPTVAGGNKIYVHRRLNASSGTFWPPIPLDSLQSFSSGDSSPFIIAMETELYPGKFKSWFQFNAIDSFGRRPSPSFFSNVSIHLTIT